MYCVFGEVPKTYSKGFLDMANSGDECVGQKYLFGVLKRHEELYPGVISGFFRFASEVPLIKVTLYRRVPINIGYVNIRGEDALLVV